MDSYTIRWASDGYAHEVTVNARITMLEIAEALSKAQDEPVTVTKNTDDIPERRYRGGLIMWSDEGF